MPINCQCYSTKHKSGMGRVRVFAMNSGMKVNGLCVDTAIHCINILVLIRPEYLKNSGLLVNP